MTKIEILSEVQREECTPMGIKKHHFTQLDYEDVNENYLSSLPGYDKVDFCDQTSYDTFINSILEYYNEHNYARYGSRNIVFPPVHVDEESIVYWNKEETFTVFILMQEPMIHSHEILQLINSEKCSKIPTYAWLCDMIDDKQRAHLTKRLKRRDYSDLSSYIEDGIIYFKHGCCSTYGLYSHNKNQCCQEKYQRIKATIETLYMVEVSNLVKYIGYEPCEGKDMVDVVLNDKVNCRSFKSYLRCMDPKDFQTIRYFSLISNGIKLYMQLFEHILHCQLVRYRFDHFHCDKSFDYTGLFLQPYRDVADYVIYKSFSGYKIFLKNLDCDFGELHRWVNRHPTINGESVNLPTLTCNMNLNILEQVKNDPSILSSEITYQSLLARLSQSQPDTSDYYQCMGYLKLSAFKCYGIREVCRGYILAGEPGLGKTYDILNSVKDSYWLPYDSKTKQYYDGYHGQSTMIIDDIGHYCSDEWKLIIRLVNDAPWSFPMGQAKNKDCFENVSRTLLLTTNNLTKLMDMDVNSRDAICRRMEVYQYIGNNLVEHRIYNKHLGKYELISTINRDELRQRLSIMTLPTEIVIPRVQSNLIVPITMGVNIITSYFKLPDITRLLTSCLSHIKLPCKAVTADRAVMANLVLKSCLEFFDWSRCVGKKGNRQRRYLKAVTGYGDIIDDIDYTKITNYSDFMAIAEGRYQKTIGGFTLCGVNIPKTNFDNVYHELEESRTVYHPAIHLEGYSTDKIPDKILEQYDLQKGCVLGAIDRPAHYTEERYQRYVKRDDASSVYDIYAPSYVSYESKIAPFRSELVTIIDESSYRPTNPIKRVTDMKAVNSFLHPKTVSKTMKRRLQRKCKRHLKGLNV